MRVSTRIVSPSLSLFLSLRIKISTPLIFAVAQIPLLLLLDSHAREKFRHIDTMIEIDKEEFSFSMESLLI